MHINNFWKQKTVQHLLYQLHCRTIHPHRTSSMKWELRKVYIRCNYTLSVYLFLAPRPATTTEVTSRMSVDPPTSSSTSTMTTPQTTTTTTTTTSATTTTTPMMTTTTKTSITFTVPDISVAAG